MRKANDGKKGGYLKGQSHQECNDDTGCGIRAIVTDAGGKPVELEGDEVILTKKAMADEGVYEIIVEVFVGKGLVDSRNSGGTPWAAFRTCGLACFLRAKPESAAHSA